MGDAYFQIKVIKKLNNITAKVEALAEENIFMSAQMDALILEVKNTRDVEESALVLIDSLASRIQALIDELASQAVDTAQLETLAADLAVEREKLAAAVATTPTSESASGSASESSSESSSESASESASESGSESASESPSPSASEAPVDFPSIP